MPAPAYNPPCRTIAVRHFRFGCFAAAVTLVLALDVTTRLITPCSFQRDEFLYFAMGAQSPPAGNGLPAAISVLSQFIRATTGMSLLVVRIGPAIRSTLLVVFVILFARKMAGRTFAEASRRSPSSRRPRCCGATRGAGLLIKLSIVIIGAGVLVAVIMLLERRLLVTPWPYAAAALVSIGAAPNAKPSRLITDAPPSHSNAVTGHPDHMMRNAAARSKALR